MQRSLKLSSFIILLASVSILYSCQPAAETEKKMQFNKGTLYYTGRVTDAEATQLGDFLATDNFYFDGKEKSVKLDKRTDKKGETWILLAALNEKDARDSAYIITYTAMGKYISQQVFAYEPVEVQLCNEKFEKVTVLPFSRRH